MPKLEASDKRTTSLQRLAGPKVHVDPLFGGKCQKLKGWGGGGAVVSLHHFSTSGWFGSQD